MILFLLINACAELPQNDGISCNFEQKKKSALFRKELKSNGHLWVRGQRLRFDNGPTSIIVSGNQVVMKNGDKSETLSLSQAPKIEAFLGTFSGLFLGKIDAGFESKCTGDQVELTPKGEQPVKKLTLTFANKLLTRVEMVESSGDEISLTLSACKFGPAAAPDATFQ